MRIAWPWSRAFFSRGRAPISHYGRRHRVADTHFTGRHRTHVREGIAQFLGIADRKSTPDCSQCARIPDLAAALGIKRGRIEHNAPHSACAERSHFYSRCINQCEHPAASLGGGIT